MKSSSTGHMQVINVKFYCQHALLERKVVMNEGGDELELHPGATGGRCSMVFSPCVLSPPAVVSNSATLWTIARQAPPSLGILQARILEWVAYPFSNFPTPSLVAQRSKQLPATRETWVRSLGREDPLEKETITHSSILAWRIPWTEEPGGLQSTGSQRVGYD